MCWALGLLSCLTGCLALFCGRFQGFGGRYSRVPALPALVLHSMVHVLSPGSPGAGSCPRLPRNIWMLHSSFSIESNSLMCRPWGGERWRYEDSIGYGVASKACVLSLGAYTCRPPGAQRARAIESTLWEIRNVWEGSRCSVIFPEASAGKEQGHWREAPTFKTGSKGITLEHGWTLLG